ncbi:hypothetical protein ElyMa_005420900 [Elysia marginata]|uniref:Uncharacterized protein n=1 Tax=Elysia marginata TaxID=1093978 RepID=A0AAV4EJX2_9GAST|nr:hypothetical protein ElyMa_005420900 [Elysia marginata]
MLSSGSQSRLCQPVRRKLFSVESVLPCACTRTNNLLPYWCRQSLLFSRINRCLSKVITNDINATNDNNASNHNNANHSYNGDVKLRLVCML